MEAQAEVALLLHCGLARVQPDPHAKLRAVRPIVRRKRALRRGSCRDGVACPLEDDEEGVAFRSHLLTAVLRERRAHELPVLGEHLRVLLAQAPQEPR